MGRSIGIAIWTLGVLMTASQETGAAPYAPRVGQRHPDFTLPEIGDRRPVSLAQFRGKKVLLVQFASW